jgi:NAD(P)-dependent dehydrogenase (short-subunit alcohol dehydrogenase family)
MQKTFLIAGGSSGIGLALVNQLVKNENEVIVLSRNRNSLPENIVHHVVDFNADELHLPTIEKPLDGFVYLPGTIQLKPFKTFSKKDFLDDFNLNVLGATECLRKYLPNLLLSKNASVVLMSSVVVTVGMPFHALISSSKGALEGLTKSLAAEFSPMIRVNAIAPSLTETPLAEKFLNTEEKRKAGAERHPMKKIGEAEDVAALISFLLSAQSKFITGQIIKADGGMSSIRKF